MKRKLLITFTACLLASFACFAACGGGEEHEHAYKESAVEPTCTQPGYVVYLCDCGDQYKEITSDPTGHDYGEPIWDWTGFESATATFVCAHDSAHVQTVNASVDVDNSVPPTCSESGVNSLVATAEFDGRVFTDYANETVAALNHTLSLIGANAATCEEEGNVEYRQCSACGKLFSDEAAANEIDFASTRLAPLGHDYVQPEWDCDWEEKEGYLTVSCKNDASHGKTVPAEINERVIRPVTCEQDGEAEYVAKATVDGEEFTLSHSVSLPHYGHNYSETDWAWTGYDKAKLILSCQNDNSHKIEITAAVTSSIFSSPTCTSTGEKIYIATAEYNGKTYSVQKTEILPRTEHDYTLYLWHWNDEKEATAEFSCNQCDYRQSVTAAITKKITLSPTCIKTGTAEYTATATLYGKTFTDVKTEAEQKISHNFTSGACPICGQPAPTEGLIYKTENGITVCAGISDSVTATEISIAPTYEGMPVKGVGSRAFAYNNKNIVSVYIPDSVETIGSQAFSGCSSLRRVTISNDALTVQSNAFENCSLLDSLYITNLKAWCGSSFSDYTANPLYTASNLYLNGELLTEAVIPEGVTAVNANVFAGCNSIVSVTLPKGLTKIGNQAFYRCNKLVEVRNYSSLSVSKGASDNGGVALYALNVTSGNESILAADGDFIFCDREDILLGYTGDETALTLPSSRNGKNYSVYKYAFYKNRTLTSLSASGGASSIGDYAFSYCPALSSVSLGKDVTEIGDCSFSYCRALTDISIGKNVTEIGNSAFYFCDPVALSLGESVRSIGEYAFAECRRLTDLTLGAALSSVDKNAFYNCNDIFAVRINDLSAYCKIDGLSNIRHEKSPSFSRLYLNGKALTHLVVPSDVTEIPDCAFKNCIDLLCVTLHENVTKIGNNAFFGCNKLLEVFNFSPLYIYAGSSNNGFVAYNARAVYTSASDVGKLKEQNDFVFYDDGAVSLVCYSGQNETLSLPDSFNGRNYSVYKYAFAGNPFVTEIRAGAGVESIGDGAFSACTALTKVALTKSVTSVGSAAFSGCVSLTDFSFNGAALSTINEMTFSGCVSLAALTLPDSVSSIGNSAFGNCKALKSFTVSDKVRQLGTGVFAGCSSLESIVIPESVTKAGSQLFKDCANLKKVTVNAKISALGNDFFFGCTALTEISLSDTITSIESGAFYACRSLENVRLPDGLTKIDFNAFYGCSSLKEIIVPEALNSVNFGAFNGCDSLAAVYYTGDGAAWSNIDISASGNACLTSATVYYYSEQQPSASADGVFWHYGNDGTTPVIWKK